MANLLTRRTWSPRPDSAVSDRSAELRALEAAQQHKLTIHPSVTLARLSAAMLESSSHAEKVKICTLCGAQHTGGAAKTWHLRCRSRGGVFGLWGRRDSVFSGHRSERALAEQDEYHFQGNLNQLLWFLEPKLHFNKTTRNSRSPGRDALLSAGRSELARLTLFVVTRLDTKRTELTVAGHASSPAWSIGQNGQP